MDNKGASVDNKFIQKSLDIGAMIKGNLDLSDGSSQSSMEHGHNLYPSGQRVCLPYRHHGLA